MADSKKSILETESTVVVAPDEMNAAIFISTDTNEEKYTKEDIITLLNHYGVVQGIDEELIEKIAREEMYNKMVSVAHGKEPIAGKDGYFEILFRTELPSKPDVLEDGSVDYSNMDIFETVSKNQKIAEYHKATTGKMGYTVTGKLVIPKRGKDKPAIRGTNFYIDDAGINYYAALDGRIAMQEGKMVVSDLFVLNEDLTPSVGNINFKGDVHIKGNVKTGMEIKATGGVVVDGIMEGACIRADKDIVIRQGAMGENKAYIESKEGNVFGKFFEGVQIRCKGNLVCNNLLNSDVTSGKKVEISGKNGSIVSGVTRALVSISSCYMGSEDEIPTIIGVGVSQEYKNHYQEIKRQLIKVDFEIDIFTKALQTQPNLREKITMALEMKNNERERLKAEEEELLEEIQLADNAVIMVKDKAYPGTTINIDTESLALKSKLESIFFRKQEEHIAIFKNA